MKIWIKHWNTFEAAAHCSWSLFTFKVRSQRLSCDLA